MTNSPLFKEMDQHTVNLPTGCFPMPLFNEAALYTFIFTVLTQYVSGCKDLPSFDPNMDTEDKTSTEGEKEENDDVDIEEIEKEIDPVSTCPDHRCLISGSITEDQTWRAENQYVLRGQVLVGDGEQETRLTIEPGTRIFGERQTTGMLIVQRHSKVYASGTPEAPIVFSSDQPLKDRRRGDWGGIILNGNAPVNGCEQNTPCERYGDSGTGWYGGGDANDNSGVIQYVRVEYAGKQPGPDFDHGGLSLRGVGSATLVDHLHLHLNENDGISMVGGTVDLKHVLSTGSADDGFAWTDGWCGRAQYIVTQQYDDAGDNGLEAANNTAENDSEPISAPTLYNATLVGVRGGSHSGIGILFKDGTRGTIRKSVVLGFGTACLNIDHASTWTQLDTESLSIHDTIINCDTLFLPNQPDVDPDDAFLADFFYRDADNHATEPGLTSPFSTTSPDFSPAVGSPLVGGDAITPEDSFFDGVNFVGAVNPELDWTQSIWITEGILGKESGESDTAANDVKNELECTGTVCIASGTFTADMRWTADKLYILRGSVFIGDGEQETNLKIEPGTVIQGESATAGLLVVQRNATITAKGTATMPIVFTSDRPFGSRARGDWGGIILNGNAPINGCNETVCESWGEGGTGWYGGNDAEDNSGILKYVRIEFAGKQLGPDNELNGLALQGVGSTTELSHLHLHMNKDDAIEFFGGTVSAQYILATGTGDDALDWTQGWQGSVQFFVSQQYFDAGDNGIEADNSGSDNSAEPFSDPLVTNFTLIGSPDSQTSDLGILLREGTRGDLSNGVVMGFGDACLDVDHAQTWHHVDEEQLTLRGIIMDCALSFKENYPETDPENVSLDAFFSQGENNVLGDPELNDPFERETPRLAPRPDGTAATDAIVLSDPSITSVSFRGGVDPDKDWISTGIADGWIDILAR